MTRGRAVTLYLDRDTVQAVDRMVRSKLTTWRSRSRFINDATDGALGLAKPQAIIKTIRRKA